MMMSPKFRPIRNSIASFLWDGGVAFGHEAPWISTAQRTAPTTLANSTSTPSPVVLTMRPRCSVILGSITALPVAFQGYQRAFLVNAHQARIAGNIRA